MKKLLFFTALLLTLYVGCQTDRAKLRRVNLSVEVQRFDRDLFALDLDSLREQVPALQQKYGEFFRLFCTGIIGIGEPTDEDFLGNRHDFLTDEALDANFEGSFFDNLYDFLTNEVVSESFEAAQEVFVDMKWLNSELTKAFKRYTLAFPGDSIPDVIAYVAGFNQSIMLADGLIGIGLDKYLGADYELYDYLGFFRYVSRNMYPTKIPSDVMRSWAAGKFPMQTAQNDLLSHIVWEGKLLYFTKQMLPAHPDTSIFGFTAEQLKLCENNERFMWLQLIERKLLFSTHQFTIARFTQERPFTQDFSQEAPGRAANWLGYRIVQQYMRRTNATLVELMNNNNYREILEKSGYNPRR